MTDTFRALCAELVDDLELCDWPYKLKDTIRADIERARALLAEPDGPAVPDGREPASVTGKPSDQDLYDYWISTSPEFGCADPVGFARAALARWGQHTAPPAEEIGANSYQSLCRQLIKDLAAARDALDAWTEYFTENNQPTAKHFCMKEYESARDAHSKACNAMAILRRQVRLGCSAATPVPVSERLPGPEDCDAEGRCWLGGHQMGSGTRTWLLGYPAWAERFPAVHHFWLPAAALPLPPYEVQL